MFIVLAYDSSNMSDDSTVTQEYVDLHYGPVMNRCYEYLVAVAIDHRVHVDDIPQLTMLAVKIVEKSRDLQNEPKPRRGAVKRLIVTGLVRRYINDYYLDGGNDTMDKIIEVSIQLVPILIDTIVDAIRGDFHIERTLNRCIGICITREPKYI